MSIAQRIILLIVLLLAVLAVNTWTGLSQISRIRKEFSSMVTHDVTLIDAVSSFYVVQLQKNILLQKIISIAEEIGFEQDNFARRSYLNDQLGLLSGELNALFGQGQKHFIRARAAYHGALQAAFDEHEIKKLKLMDSKLKELEDLRIKYNADLMQIFNKIQGGAYQLSLDDVTNFAQLEALLAKDVQFLLDQVQQFAQDSLVRARQWEAKSERDLLWILWVTVILSLLLSIRIVLSIIRPLRQLHEAARQIGEGNFKVQMDIRSSDELSRLAQSFNTMSHKLEEYKIRIERQNSDLKTANEELDKFIQVMGHEIRDPLTVMIASCSFIETHGKGVLDEKTLNALQGIRKSASKMHKMVIDLLNFAKRKRMQ